MDSKKILNNSLFCLEKRRMRVCVILPDYERLAEDGNPLFFISTKRRA